MKSWHITAEWFVGVKSEPANPGCSGFEYVATRIYAPCGVVVRAETETEARQKFQEMYRGLSPDVQPWRNIKIEPGREC